MKILYFFTVAFASTSTSAFTAHRQISVIPPTTPIAAAAAAAAAAADGRPTSSPVLCRSAPQDNNDSGSGSSFLDGIVDDVKSKIRIAKESSAAGSDFKQIIADVLAGDYDVSATNAKLDELIASAPCVMFIWEASPFSKKAIRAMEIAGADVKIVRLDDPWDEGNPLRAELGKRTGKTSVPSIWIGGEYVGGFDGGVSEESPGIVDLAFRGTLLPKLEAAGALKTDN